MAGSAESFTRGALLALAALAASQVHAQADTAYRCVSRGSVTYSQAPCAGGRLVGDRPHRETDKSRPPPQDRAVAARRAGLSAGERQECRVLDVRLREEQRMLRAKGTAATLDDEMPLVFAKKRFRELKC